MSDFLIIGINDAECLGKGWHEKEIHQPSGIIFRSTEPVFNFSIHTAYTSDVIKSKKLFIMAAASVSLLGKNVNGKISCCGESISDFSLTSDLWNLLEFDLSGLKISPGKLDFSVEVSTPYIPDKYLHNGDHRNIGIYFSFAVIR